MLLIIFISFSRWALLFIMKNKIQVCFWRLIKRFNKNQDKLKRVRDELISGMHEGISIPSSRHGKNFVNLCCWFWIKYKNKIIGQYHVVINRKNKRSRHRWKAFYLQLNSFKITELLKTIRILSTAQKNVTKFLGVNYRLAQIPSLHCQQ